MINTIQRKRSILIAELRAALKTIPKRSNSEILSYCNLTSETLDDDLAFTAVPWEALRFYYYIHGVRALRLRQAGQTPDGTSYRQRVANSERRARKGGSIL